jgi:hypothetical protein
VPIRERTPAVVRPSGSVIATGSPIFTLDSFEASILTTTCRRVELACRIGWVGGAPLRWPALGLWRLGLVGVRALW